MTPAAPYKTPVLDAKPATRNRSISLFTATSIVVANMIGTGVFTSLGYQVGDLPSGFVIMALWILGGITALCGALVYGELAAALPRSGGEYYFLKEIFHPAAGFVSGWLSITVGFSVPVALAAMAFGNYFHAMSDALPAQWLSVAVVLLVTLVHLFGTKAGSAFQNAATVLKITLVIALIVAGLAMTNGQALSFLPRAGDEKLLLTAPFAISLVFVSYAYSGWNATAYIVGEIRQPGRNVPLSIVIGTLIVTVLYVLLNGVFLHAAPMSELKGKQEVAYVAAAHIFGEHGGRIMAGLICIGLIASVSAMTWIGPRVAVAMGEDWSILGFLAKRTSGGVPAVAILVQSVIVLVMLHISTFPAILKYIQFALTVSSFFAVLGVFVLRYRQPDLPRPYKTWGYPVTPLIFLAVSGWMLVFQFREQPRESLSGLGTLLLGLVLYFLSPAQKPAPPAPGGDIALS